MDPTFAILIAEDEAINRMFLVKIVQKLGAKALEAKTGKEAVDKYFAEAEDIQLIFMDLSMPEMDGIEAVREIRKTNKTVPIVALTAHSSEEDRDLCMNSGFNEMLIKPVQLPKLRETILRYSAHNPS